MLSPGEKLGPYEIVGPLGAGGMGEVYRARDTRLDRDVAVKILPKHLSENPQFRQRFEREARAVSSLSHPNICSLYDIGRENGTDYLVMECLDGETLDERLKQGALSTDEVLRYAIQIAEALNSAHKQGFIHRDLKPGNVMITKSGAKLLDFGLAKSFSLGSNATDLTSSPTLSSPLTAEGAVIGTFQYMAPEILEGKEADTRSDIFAFGATLYEMATGKTAFEGKTQAGVIGAVLERTPPPLTSVQPMASPALERLIETCLEKDPDQRRQSMHDLVLELQWIAAAGSQAGVPSPVRTRRKKRTKLAWKLAGLFGVGTIVLGFFLLQLMGRETRVVRASLPAPEGTAYHVDIARPGPAAISPDGRLIVFSAEEDDGENALWVRSLNANSAQQLTGTKGASYPFWSPDSRKIGFFTEDGKLRKIDASGGPALTLCEASNGKGGTWNGDGVILFAPDFDSPIHRVSSAGGESIAVTVFDSSRADDSHRHPWFLPDGRRFLYYARTSGVAVLEGKGVVQIASLDGGEDTTLIRSHSNASFASGHILFMRESTLMAQPFDSGKLETTEDPFPIAENVELLGGAMRGVFSASENGILIYQEDADTEFNKLVWVDREGRETGILSESGLHDRAQISPDGTLVVAEIMDPDRGTMDLWIYEVARGIRTRFTFDPADDIVPSWSSDGEKILFTRRDRGASLYVKEVGGSAEEELLLEHEDEAWGGRWSTDGRFVAFGTGEWDIWILPLFGDRVPYPFLESEFQEFLPTFSPDGRWLAYTSDESGKNEVYVSPFPGPGRKWQVSVDGGLGPQWRNDGRALYYLGPDRSQMMAEVDGRGETFSVGALEKLFQNTKMTSGDISDDGELILLQLPVGDRKASSLGLVLNWTAALEE